MSVRAWLSLTRVSNLPTVWSNVLVGLVLGGLAAPGEPTALTPPLADAAVMLLAISAIYLAGMILNDVFDLEWDRAHRPERPLASGAIAPRRAAGAATGLIGAALLALVIGFETWHVGALGAALVAAVVLYDGLHKRWSAAGVVMGACRALVYMTAAAAVTPPTTAHWWATVAPVAALMGAYVAVVTFLAQRETDRAVGPRRWLGPVLFVLPLLALTLGPMRERAEAVALSWVVSMGAVLGSWLGFALGQTLAVPSRTPRAVGAWLAGIALIDAWLAVLLAAPLAAIAAVGCFVLAMVARRWIAGT